MKTTSYTERWSPMWRDLPVDLLSRSAIAHWAPIPLRLIVGYGFMEHGFAKLARGLDAFPAILQALGVPAPHLMGWLREIFSHPDVSGSGLIYRSAENRRGALAAASWRTPSRYGQRPGDRDLRGCSDH